MYWVAHLVYLVSPFTARFEKIDGRFLLSLLGLRFIDIESNFYYLNAAWWYFGMLIQFYLIFPILFWAARKLGPWTFLLGACALGFFVRYLLLVAYPQNGMWVQGGFALCRLPEFALGMALGMWDSRAPERMERFLLGGLGLLAGVVLYPAALQLYHGLAPYIFVDFATGGCCFLVLVGLAGIIARFPFPAKVLGLVGAFSYGVYLIHHPYVIWLGLRIREQPIWMFFLITIATLAVLCAWGMLLEKATNALVNFLLRAKGEAGELNRGPASLLIRAHPHHDCRDALDLDRGIVEISVGQLREMDQFIRYFLQFAAHLFSRLHPQFDRLPDLLGQNRVNGVVRLKGQLALGKRTWSGQGDHR